MRIKVFLLCLVIFFVSFANSSGSANPPNRFFYYLGRVADGYPADLVSRELGEARAKYVGLDEGLVVFGVGPLTSATKFLTKLPFVKEIYVDKEAVRNNPALANSKMVQKFLSLPGRKSLVGKVSTVASGQRAGSYLLQGQEGLTRDMATLDSAIRAKARTAVTSRRGAASLRPRPMATDDIYEPNNDWASATVLTDGTYPGLQCLDNDYYKVNISAGKDILVTINFTHADGNLYLTLYDSSHAAIMTSWGNRDFSRVQGSNLSAGDYFVYVRGETPTTTNSYSMTISTGNVLGDISGQVTNESAAAISGLRVYFYDNDYFNIGQAITNVSGDYTFGAPPVNCTLWFEGPHAGNYISEWYNNKTSHNTADQIAVAAGSSNTADAQLATGGMVTGLVTAEGTSTGIYNVYVDFYDSVGNWLYGLYTDSGGNYSARGLVPGQAKVLFDTYSATAYLAEWYNNKSSFDTADPITITKGATLPNVDAALAQAGQITGTVTDSLSAVLPDARVDVYDQNGTYVSETWTNGLGVYACGQMTSGSYKLRFSLDYQNCIPEWYNNVRTFESAQTIAVTAGATVSGIDAQLSQGGGIQGKVTDEFANNLDVLVKVFSLNGIEVARGESNGAYSVSGIPPGTYRVWFDPYYNTSFGSQWYNGQGSFSDADNVIVLSGQNTKGINAQLAKSCHISGTVKNNRDQTLRGVVVALYDLNHHYVLSAQTSVYGDYELYYKAGSYKVYFDPLYSVGTYLSEWYDNKSTFDTASTLAVAEGGSATVNANLDSPPSIGLIAPAGGTTWYTGTTQAITWTADGTQNAYVKIQLYRGTILTKTMTSKTANDGSFDWAIPTATATAANYKVKVTTIDNKVSGTSGTFTIAKPSITITAPTTGTTWTRGTTHTITWNKYGPQNAYVKIQLFQGTAKKQDINMNTDNDGSYDWAIPTSLPTGSNFKIKITTLDGKIIATSSNFILN